MDTDNFQADLIEENEALQNQLVEIKRQFKASQKSTEDLSRQIQEKEKQILQLIHLNKTNERVITHLRERAEESAHEIKQLQQELEKPAEDKRRALLLQEQLKAKQEEVAKFLEIIQAKDMELQRAKQGKAPVPCDGELKAAQLHLAKKMKEVSELTEQSDKYRQRIAELEEAGRVWQKEVKELKEREKKLQQACEEAETRINYFKTVEARFNKLQGLIHNLEEGGAPKVEQGDLFSPKPRLKESLFE